MNTHNIVMFLWRKRKKFSTCWLGAGSGGGGVREEALSGAMTCKVVFNLERLGCRHSFHVVILQCVFRACLEENLFSCSQQVEIKIGLGILTFQTGSSFFNRYHFLG